MVIAFGVFMVSIPVVWLLLTVREARRQQRPSDDSPSHT